MRSSTPKAFAVSRSSGSVRDKLERYELIGPLDPNHFFPTLEAAVEAFHVKRRQVDQASKPIMP
jgi:hypothetical protein